MTTANRPMWEWLSSRATFQAGENFTIAAGRSAKLPGIFVSATPIEVTSTGELRGKPWSGELRAEATIQAVVGPGGGAQRLGAVALGLLVLGLLAGLAVARNR